MVNLELLDGSYSVTDIQKYFEYIIKKDGEKTDNPPIRIYMDKIENRIMFKIKKEYYLELLATETMKLLGSIKKVLHVIVPNYLLDQLLDISLYNFILLKTFNSEFSYVEVWLLINILNRLR